MNINPGELNKKIQIIQKTDGGINPNGYPIEGEKIIRECWAKFSNISGTEIVKANSEFSSAKTRFLVRHSKASIDTDMIIRYAGKDYGIVYINTYGDGKEYMEIWAERLEKV